MEIKEILKELCAIEAPSGREVVDEENLKRIVMPYFDEYKKLNCYSYMFIKKCGKDNAKRVLLDAHFDQIGLMVTAVKDGGFLTFSSLGGLDTRTLVSSKVKVLTDDGYILGVICSKNIHSTPIKIEDLYIETDVTKEELEARGVCVGTVGTLYIDEPIISEFTYTDCSLDNRSSAVVNMRAVELLKDKELECDIYMLLSSQEESHGAGAMTGSVFANPDRAIVVDVDFGSTPETDKKDTFDLGAGPSIPISVQCDRKMTKKLLAISKEKEIPAHPALNPTSTGTNAIHVPFTIGIPTAVVGLPLRNMHTVYETVDIRDIESSAKLIAEYILSEYEVKKEA